MKTSSLVGYIVRLHCSDRRLRQTLCGIVVFCVGLCTLVSWAVVSGYESEDIEPISYSYLYSFSGRVGYIVPLLIAGFIVVSEWKSGQLLRTQILTRNRTKTFTSVALAAQTIAGVASIIVLFICFTVTGCLITLGGHDPLFFTPTQLLIVLRIALLHVLWASVGIGLGFMFRSQSLLVGVVLSFAIFIEPTISAISNRSQVIMDVTKWLPGPLNWSISWNADVGNVGVQTAIGLRWYYAIVVMGVYTLALNLIAYMIVTKRDIERR